MVFSVLCLLIAQKPSAVTPLQLLVGKIGAGLLVSDTFKYQNMMLLFW